MESGKDIFKLYNAAPTLSKCVASKVICAIRCFNVDYLNYNSTNDKTTESKVGVLRDELEKNETSNCYRSIVRECLRKINKNEKTRTSNEDIDRITENIVRLGKAELKAKLKNQNKDYELMRILLVDNNNVSLCSKFCFHLAQACFNNDCHYSKYDRVVRKNLYHYKNLVKEKITKTRFDEHNFGTYIAYCDVIEKLCNKTKLSRNEIDQIIWVYFRQQKE